MRTIYIGMDIHKNFIQAVAVDEQGNRVTEQRFGADGAGIKAFIESFHDIPIKAAIESTCSWYHVYDTLESLGIDTTLVNIRRTKVIAEAKIKTDRLDALVLAQCLRTGFIAKSWIPPKPVRELRNIIRHRLSLKKDITKTKNRIHSTLLRNGIKHGYSDLFGKAGMAFLRNLELSESEKYRLDSYLRIMESLIEEKNNITKKINALCKVDEQAMLLTSLKGIGYYSAMIILSEIGDIKRFSNPKKVCNYAGLAPRTRQSGSHIHHGRVLKECNKNLKWILNQCVHSHIRFCPDSPISRLYYRISKKKGPAKAIVAASRKMLTCIWHMLMKGEVFKPGTQD